MNIQYIVGFDFIIPIDPIFQWYDFHNEKSFELLKIFTMQFK